MIRWVTRGSSRRSSSMTMRSSGRMAKQRWKLSSAIIRFSILSVSKCGSMRRPCPENGLGVSVMSTLSSRSGGMVSGFGFVLVIVVRVPDEDAALRRQAQPDGFALVEHRTGQCVNAERGGARRHGVFDHPAGERDLRNPSVHQVRARVTRGRELDMLRANHHGPARRFIYAICHPECPDRGLDAKGVAVACHAPRRQQLGL